MIKLLDLIGTINSSEHIIVKLGDKCFDGICYRIDYNIIPGRSIVHEIHYSKLDNALVIECR